ncbi:hypothetical protein M4D55_09055 [Metabacillus idriensis]|uniref:hypothetical protein n=1 Tax=Metabacillus idriensis TaxID=324768 RepID=UPI0008A9BDBE|nr:hypothetical protein [Metabacillus idriensis]MCM3595927.1 hypothetical protein [Metabacillus idriensis]OHR69782.1 hypothetical protein HMPREF3291_07485 [Bacillus sp. HMSC76G11]
MTENRELLEVYRKLWSNRQLEVSDDDMQTLLGAIKVELQDELTHPRLRKNTEQKFFSAVKRISMASLGDQEKLTLIDLHIKVYEEIRQST